MAISDDHYLSSKNKSTTLLGADETCSGDWEFVGNHSEVGVVARLGGKLIRTSEDVL